MHLGVDCARASSEKPFRASLTSERYHEHTCPFFCESPPGLTSLHLLSQLLLSSCQYSSGFPPLVPPVSFPQQIRKRSTHLDQSNRHCRQHDNIRSVKGNPMELGNNAFFLPYWGELLHANCPRNAVDRC